MDTPSPATTLASHYRIERELGAGGMATVYAVLSHPHILPLFDSGDADGQMYYVMPSAEGHSLRDRLDDTGQVPGL